MIETYKMLSGIYDMGGRNPLKLYSDVAGRRGNRGNSKKLFVRRSRLDIRKYNFSTRVAKIWNSLPDKIVDAPSMNAFKNRLDNYWRNQDILYDYRATLNFKTGSHEVNSENDNNEEFGIEDPETEPALENNHK